MSTIIPKLRIQHFKSIKDLSLDCERINVFIGKPNAGKSNILEAISLLGQSNTEMRIMEGIMRYSSVFQLFNNFDTNKSIHVCTDLISATLNYTLSDMFAFSIEPTDVLKKRQEILAESSVDFDYAWKEFDDLYRQQGGKGFADYIIGTYREDDLIEYHYALRKFPDIDLMRSCKSMVLDAHGKISSRNIYDSNVVTPVKRYDYRNQSNSDNFESDFFLPPHGGNFYRIVRTNKELRQEIQNFLKPNGLELMLDDEKREVSVLQREEDALIRLPLHLLPDTFQRYIFHLAAIMSNRQSVLLFEEPEVHAYGPYIYQLAQYILDDEGGNQYFVTTHNPYFLIPLIQKGKDVAVFTTWFENFETRARRLSEAELSEMLDYGVDVFLNLEHFIPA